jgi:AcrR family transcriptional regulator
VREAVRDATLALLVEKGYEGLSIAEVASRARIHETSIYRRWGTKPALVMDVLLTSANDQIPVPNTGSLRDDLVQLVRSVELALTSSLGVLAARFSVSLLEYPEQAAARREYWRRRFERASVIFERARARGELTGQIDAVLVFELLVAPLFMRALVTGEPLKPALAASIVDVALHGILAGAPTKYEDAHHRNSANTA